MKLLKCNSRDALSYPFSSNKTRSPHTLASLGPGGDPLKYFDDKRDIPSKVSELQLSG